MKTYSYILALLLIPVFAFAQENYSKKISIEKQVIKKSGQELSISMDINISKLNLNSQQMITLTPVIRSADNTAKKELAPVVISGCTRNKVLKRTLKLKGEPRFTQPPFAMVRRNSPEPQVIQYKATIPYDPWLRKGKLFLDQEITGCALCGLGKEERLLASPLLKQEFKPVYKVNYIAPEKEAVKKRTEELEIFLNYKVNSSVVLPTFNGNEAELSKVETEIQNLKNNSDITLTGISITGFASPEGTYLYNMNLSERRAKSLAAYLQKTYNLDKKLFTLDWKGEDWEGLTKALEGSTLEDKDKVLEIIKSTDIFAGREAKIMKLNSGKTYQTMLTEMFPALRRNKCIFNFTVIQFTLEKAKEQIRTNPKLLSLDEMYQVASSYPKGAQDRNEAFEIAAKMYPDNTVAVNNLAAMMLENGRTSEAMTKLERLNDQPQVWNNLGIVLAQSGKYAEAKEYFQKAAEKGLPEAKENLEQLNTLLEEL